VTLLLTASVRFRTFAGGFPQSPQSPMGKRAALHRGGVRQTTRYLRFSRNRSAQSQVCQFPGEAEQPSFGVGDEPSVEQDRYGTKAADTPRAESAADDTPSAR